MSRAGSLLLALTVAATPCTGRAYDDEDPGPICDEARAVMAGEESDCDGVIIGPKRLGSLLEARERVAVCEVDLGLARDLYRIEGERCDGRLGLLTQALDRANERLRQPPRWQWETGAVGVALGLVVGLGLAYAVSR